MILYLPLPEESLSADARKTLKKGNDSLFVEGLGDTSSSKGGRSMPRGRVQEYIDARGDELVGLLQALVRIPSVVTEGEGECQAFVEETLRPLLRPSRPLGAGP